MIIAYISDVHFPFHHRQAWELTLTIVERLQPHLIHLGGDIFDFEPLSRFTVKPAYRLLLQQHIDTGTRELQRVREACPSAIMEYRQGNHELWLEKRLIERGQEFFGLRALHPKNLLSLSDLSIQWIPEMQRLRHGKLWFIHGHEVRTGAEHPAQSLYRKLGGNIIAGHVHKFDTYSHREFRGEEHAAWTNGCLRTFDPSFAPNCQWHLGISIVDLTKSGNFDVMWVRYRKQGGKLVGRLDGELYQ